MHPEDIQRLGLATENQVRITTDHMSLELGVKADLSIMPGSCSVPEHFNDPPVKDLMTLSIDPDTKVPYFKQTHVTVEKV